MLNLKVRKIFILALALSLPLAFLGGCDSRDKKENAPKSRPSIGVLLYRADDIYISMVGSALREAFAGRADAVIFDSRGDQVTQSERISKFIAEGIDGLAVNLVDTQAAASIVDEAKKADIPVVFFNREPDLNTLKLYNKACFVGTNTREAGVLQGQLIAELWKKHPGFDRNGDGKFQYVMFQGNADNPEAIARTEYSIKEARALGVDMQQLGQTNVCNWDADLAHAAMQVALVMHPGRIEMVVSNNDSMALGAIRALNEAGFNKPGGPKEMFIPVVGVDAVPQALEAIKTGVMSATVKQDDKGMGKAIAELLLNIVQGRNFLEGTAYSWDESDVSIRIPYSPVSGGD